MTTGRCRRLGRVALSNKNGPAPGVGSGAGPTGPVHGSGMNRTAPRGSKTHEPGAISSPGWIASRRGFGN